MTPRPQLRAVVARSRARARRRALATIGAAIALAMALVALSHQYANTYTLAREETRLQQRRHDLIAENASLRDEIERLETDDRYIERIARRQLGLVRPGEIELLVVPYDGTVAAPGAVPRGGAPTRTQPRRDTGLTPTDSVRTRVNAPTPRPHRGIGVWAIGVRDAMLRLLHTPLR